MRWPFTGRRERLRRQAADWIAKLNGPHDARNRAAFERWYSADTDHAAAYDRLAALFEVAGGVRPAVAAPPRTQRGGIPQVRFAFAAAAAGVVLLAFAVFATRQPSPSPRGGAQVAMFATTGSQTRRIVLRDGSEVLLAPGSELEVSIGSRERRLRLAAGEGRFKVFHEARPFIVAADGTEVLARGTQFIIRLGKEGMLVSLIEGRVEVSYPLARSGTGRQVASLTAGQRLAVPPSQAPFPASANASGAPPRPAMIAFDDARLGEAVAAMNGRAPGRIVLADPALAERRVTGTFRADDADAFAQGIGAALDLEVTRTADGSLSLNARAGRNATS